MAKKKSQTDLMLMEFGEAAENALLVGISPRDLEDTLEDVITAYKFNHEPEREE